jgi:hypothetical protein
MALQLQCLAATGDPTMMLAQETPVLNPQLQETFAALLPMIQQAARDGTAVHEVERALWTWCLRLGSLGLRQFFDLLGSGDVGPSLDLPDGQAARRLEHPHARRYVSVFGEFRLERTAYGSREGQAIACVPLDNRLQLPESPFSYLLQDWDQGLCAEQAFGQISHTIERMLGLKQSVDSLERMNEQMARQVAGFREDRPMPEPEAEGELLVLSADGKGVVMRRAAESPAPPAHRTKGDKASQKRMATVGAAYSVDRYVRTPEQVVAALFRDGPEPDEPRPVPQGKQVWASLERPVGEQTVSGMDVVFAWLLNEVAERNPGLAKEMVHLCDGQEALWEACARHLPKRNSTSVLDILHVTPRLWQAAHLFHPEKSPEAEGFVRERLLRVLRGGVKDVVRGLRQMGTKRGLKGSKKKALRVLCAYLEKNAERMRYDEYLSKGYPIASGVIEGACRHLVKDRMERAGMHWTMTGAQAMLDVRSVYVNGAWEEYQAYRIGRETERLYPNRSLFTDVSFPLAV